MDFSEQYIKMCKAAEEIQANEQRDEIGSWWHCQYMDEKGDREPFIACKGSYEEEWYLGKESDIWLPRQDQLQEMCGRYEYPYALLEQFYRFVKSLTKLLPSYEQLWLAFVMREKRGKVWVNGEWVKDYNTFKEA